MKFNAVKVGSTVKASGRIAMKMKCKCGDEYAILVPSELKTMPSELPAMLRKHLASRGCAKHGEIVHLTIGLPTA